MNTAARLKLTDGYDPDARDAGLEELKKQLGPGQVYRREDLAKWSNAVDRHLKQLLADGTLTMLSGGVYYCPKKTVHGDAPAEDKRREHRLNW